MPDRIKCTVSNCTFWNSNLCKASAIEVNFDQNLTSASNADDTKCHTFKSK